MATKKKPSTKSKPAPKPQPKPESKSQPPARLENLAARPSYDDMLDEQLVDHSGLFRVTSQLTRPQSGRDEEASLRFASDSLVMAAQRDGFREQGATLEDAVEEHAVVDEATLAEKRQRLTTLATRAQQLRSRTRR